MVYAENKTSSRCIHCGPFKGMMMTKFRHNIINTRTDVLDILTISYVACVWKDIRLYCVKKCTAALIKTHVLKFGRPCGCAELLIKYKLILNT